VMTKAPDDESGAFFVLRADERIVADYGVTVTRTESRNMVPSSVISPTT